MALAVAADPADFARLRGHGLFAGVDYGHYLRRTESQLRALRSEGVDVHLRVLEPVDYTDFCEQHLLAPDDPVARVAYAADPELAGEPFVYRGECLVELLPVLLADHLARVRISVGCSALLVAVGWEDHPEERLAAVLHYASEVYLELGAGAGEGRHLLTLRSVGLMDGQQLAAHAELDVASGAFTASGREVEALCVTLAAAVAGYGAGELLLYRRVGPGGERDAPGRHEPGERQVLGWVLVDGWLRPMSALETAATLVAVEPEGSPERLVACAGFPLPFREAARAARPPERTEESKEPGESKEPEGPEGSVAPDEPVDTCGEQHGPAAGETGEAGR
ncbi:hypothetical protein [Saccharothrix sp. ST-888]|uniref:hypothetical protein n=1 Tax=Saccharothrix sp. ST-888 TaxID=1427391 RepID=UPI0005ECB5C8|nr:hypothetical protein [Saccharothrix sp. ST-888]KJK60013.1 hypothetical protein UK12_00780 [Saccharothrix sp. ST-888]